MDLLIDFGASNIKYLIVNNSEILEHGSRNLGTIKYLISDGIIKKLNKNLIKESFDLILGELNFKKINRIFVCSEMHGITVNDYYYSWMSLTVSNKIDKKDFLARTGLKAWAGLASFTIESLLMNNEFNTGDKIGDFKECILDKSNYISNITMLSSTGLIDINNHELLGCYNDLLSIPKLSYDLNEILGYVYMSNVSVPVYFGIGDLQAALYGVGYLNQYPIVINIGTGSQIALPLEFIDNELVEKRIYIDGTLFPVLTHIPSGRILNLIKDSFRLSDFWNIWSSLTLDTVITANGSNFSFKDFANFSNGVIGSIKLHEQHNIDNYIADLANWYCHQYIDFIKKFDIKSSQKKIAITGGLIKHSGFFRDVLNYFLEDYVIEVVISDYEDVTLDGMFKLLQEEVR